MAQSSPKITPVPATPNHETLTSVELDGILHHASGYTRASVTDVLFTNAPDGVAFVRSDGLFLRVNDAYCELLGYARTELEGKRRYQDLTHPEDEEIDAGETQALLVGTRARYRVSKRYLHKRGHAIHVDLTVLRVEASTDAFLCFVKHVRPIQLNEDFYRIGPNAKGVPEMRPFYPLTQLIRDNWKAFAGLVVAGITTLGGAVHTYYTTLATLQVQTQQIEQQTKQVDRLTSDLSGRDALIDEQRKLLELLRQDVKQIKAVTTAGPPEPKN